jgi:hypothetical protein
MHDRHQHLTIKQGRTNPAIRWREARRLSADLPIATQGRPTWAPLLMEWPASKLHMAWRDVARSGDVAAAVKSPWVQGSN